MSAAPSSARNAFRGASRDAVVRDAAMTENFQADAVAAGASDCRAMTTDIAPRHAHDDIAPDEIEARARNAAVLAAGVAAWRAAQAARVGRAAVPGPGSARPAMTVAESRRRWRAAAHAAVRAFSDAHPLGLTRREDQLVRAVIAAHGPGRAGRALRVATGIPLSSFPNVVASVNRKLARHDGALGYDRIANRWRVDLSGPDMAALLAWRAP